MPARKSDSIWTDAKIDELRQLVASDMKFTADQIGLALRCSKNSVIGKCRRLKLILANGNRPDSPPKKPRVRKAIRIHGASAYGRPVVEAVFGPVDNPIPSIEDSAIPREQLKTLFDLGAAECRWAVNDGGPFLFCAAPVAFDGCPYCASHYRRSVNPTYRNALHGAT